MAAILADSSVPEDGPCGTMRRPACGRRRGAKASPGGGPPEAVSGLISACLAPVTPIGCRSGHPGPKNRGTAMVCADIGVARAGIPPGRITRDSCRYRA